MKINIDKPFPSAFFIDPTLDHLWCRWYCKFLFWKKHPKFIQRREFISLDELMKIDKTSKEE